MDEELFAYVKNYLEAHNGQAGMSPFRVRSEHIRRVTLWIIRLIQNTPAPIRTKELFTAAIFHDVGYGNLKEGESHAVNSARIFQQYAEGKDYTLDEIAFICYLIEHHSNKELLLTPNIPIELVYLMEADLLDETGAMSIVWDCLMEGAKKSPSFQQAYEHILAYSGKILNHNPMVTDQGRQYWSEKQDLTRLFLQQFAMDINPAPQNIETASL